MSKRSLLAAGCLTICTWNEWMEGGYIVPTTKDRAARLNALRKVAQ